MQQKFWEVGEFDECGGYDCMTAGIYAGNALLDGRMYGQESCSDMTEEAQSLMLADARLIAAAPDLLAACQLALSNLDPLYSEDHIVIRSLRAAIKKTKG